MTGSKGFCFLSLSLNLPFKKVFITENFKHHKRRENSVMKPHYSYKYFAILAFFSSHSFCFVCAGGF